VFFFTRHEHERKWLGVSLFLRCAALSHVRTGIRVASEDLDKMFKEVASGGGNTFGFTEFMSMMSKKMSQVRCAATQKAFSVQAVERCCFCGLD
jgi:hypothetical protein